MRNQIKSDGELLASHRRHLSQDDLADRWQMSVRTLERWRSQRQGPAFLKLGGKVVYRLSDIETFELTQRRQGDR